jgi:hypothetical protein
MTFINTTGAHVRVAADPPCAEWMASTLQITANNQQPAPRPTSFVQGGNLSVPSASVPMPGDFAMIL